MLFKRYIKSTDAEGIKKSILRAIGDHLSLADYAVFLFGSRSTQRSRKVSDFDVGLLGKQPIDFGTLAKIESEIEDLPVEVDFVDFSEVSESFKEIALKKIELCNKPQTLDLNLT